MRHKSYLPRGSTFDRRHAHVECICPSCGRGWIPGRSEFKSDGSYYVCPCGGIVHCIYVASIRGPHYDLTDLRLSGRRLSPWPEDYDALMAELHPDPRSGGAPPA